MPYTELQGSPIEKGDLWTGEVERQFIGPWAERYTFANSMALTRFNGAICNAYKITPYPDSRQTASGQNASYDDALVTLYYTTKIDGTLLVTEELTPGTMHSRGDYKSLTWSDGKPLQPQNSPIYVQTVQHYTCTMYKLPAIPAPWLTMQGYINNMMGWAKLMPLTFATETLLYNGMHLGHSLYTNGITYYKATLNFTFCSNGGLGWNAKWRETTNQYEYVYCDGVRREFFKKGAFVF